MKIDTTESTGRTMESQPHDKPSFAPSRAPAPHIGRISGFNFLPYEMSTDDNPDSKKVFHYLGGHFHHFFGFWIWSHADLRLIGLTSNYWKLMYCSMSLAYMT